MASPWADLALTTAISAAQIQIAKTSPEKAKKYLRQIVRLRDTLNVLLDSVYLPESEATAMTPPPRIKR